jgi:predicted double-glycine peptidase
MSRLVFSYMLLLVVAGCASATPEGVPRNDVAERLRPQSYLELKYKVTVGQRVDFSCGAATLATLSTYYWDRPLTETEALVALLAPYSEEERKKKRDTGFSFADLVSAAVRLGFEAEGAKIEAQELAKVAGPLVVHLDKGTFQHFSVLRKAGNGTYYLSDPIVGAIAMPEGEFTKQYTGHALAVWLGGVGLPTRSELTEVRDGTDVSLSVGPILSAPANAFLPTL